MLNGKKILLGVCGSIAAYKTALLIRLLIKSGAEVKVIMTDSAKSFITPLTLSTLAKNPVLSKFEKNDTGEWNNHVDLGLWADLMLIAPASANTIAKMANGLCDNLLSAVYLSARCPVMFAPAMDLDMFLHPSTTDNIRKLTSFGNQLIDAESGELASGLSGKGRMAEPETILEVVESYLNDAKVSSLKGKKAIITSGPTYEAIDPVRFIGNHSSGKMGHALAEALYNAGCEVTVISGPSIFNNKDVPYKIEPVTSADQMYSKAIELYPETDLAIFAAAVADYKPAHAASQKIKKQSETMTVELIKNKDIALEMGNLKTHQVNIGFALETENEKENATAKLNKKNFDLIVLNSLNDKGAGFASDTNKITIIGQDNIKKEFELKSKREVAKDIIYEVAQLLNR